MTVQAGLFSTPLSLANCVVNVYTIRPGASVTWRLVATNAYSVG